MKKLILNFLFFVGFSLILVQCAKMFPSKIKKSKQYPPRAARIKTITYNKQTKFTSFVEEIYIGKNFNRSLIPFLKNPVLPKNLMIYINNYPIFNNSNNNNISYFQLLNNTRGKDGQTK